jgi:1-acyl-sn-glycerol-3-phosphate acyltransferase
MESLLTLPDTSSTKPTLSEIWRRPLGDLESPVDRFLCRALSTLAVRYVVEIHGAEHLAPERDPFILAANHNTRLDAVLLPTLLTHLRGGRRIRFLADWPMMLVPGVASLYRRGRVIVVTRKKPRYPILDRFKERIVGDSGNAYAQCLSALRSGASIGVYPEATMNRHPRRLLRGQTGAARLALASGAPVLPVGISFPCQPRNRPIGDSARMVVEIGEPLTPPQAQAGTATLEEIRQLHHRLMREISRLSGKDWSPQARRRRERDVARELPDG